MGKQVLFSEKSIRWIPNSKIWIENENFRCLRYKRLRFLKMLRALTPPVNFGEAIFCALGEGVRKNREKGPE